jgi:hypothetical protein
MNEKREKGKKVRKEMRSEINIKKGMRKVKEREQRDELFTVGTPLTPIITGRHGLPCALLCLHCGRTVPQQVRNSCGSFYV